MSRPTRSKSLLIPPNPAVADPGSSPVSRGGILLNPLGSPSSKEPVPNGSILSSLGSGGKRSRRRSSLSSNVSTASASTSASTTEARGDAHSLSSSAATSVSGGGGGASSSTGPKLKFAPLPTSGRQRSNSITLGVASRAAMLQGVNAAQQQYYQQQQQQYSLQPQRSLAPAPHWQQQCAPVKPMWYNGGPMPDNVKTVKDLKPGLKKAWTKIRRSSSAGSSASSRSQSNDSGSTTSSVPEEDETEEEEDASGNEQAGETSSAGKQASATSSASEMDSSASYPHQTTVGPAPAATAPYGRDSAMAGMDSDDNTSINSSAISLTSTDFGADDEAEDSSRVRVRKLEGEADGSGSWTNGSTDLPQKNAFGLDTSDDPMGDATPRRRPSPPPLPPAGHLQYQHHSNQTHPYIPYALPSNRSQPGSGSNTPRRRMSMTDFTYAGGGGGPASNGTGRTTMTEGGGAGSGEEDDHQQQEQNRFDLHHQAIYGYHYSANNHTPIDTNLLRNKFERLGVRDQERVQRHLQEEEEEQEQEGNRDTHHHPHAVRVAPADEEGAGRERGEDEVEDDEEDVPMPTNSRQVKGAGMEVVG